MPTTPSNSPSFYDLLLSLSQEMGFPFAGAVDIHHPETQSALAQHVQQYDAWIASGSAGEMEYLKRGRDRRADPTLVFEQAKSVFSVGSPYPNSPYSLDPSAPLYARYLRGTDYHHTLKERLEALALRVKQKWFEETSRILTWKVCVDTSAVLERMWAQLSGLGWIGKNTMLIHPKMGSYFFLGEILWSEEVGCGPSPIPDYCGNCSKCLEACPTGAFVEKRNLKATQCISYATLEHRGPIESLLLDTGKFGRWVAGCDICQEVCPFNRKSAEAAQADSRLLTNWTELNQETEEKYKERVSKTALNRIKPKQFKRNLKIASQNI